MKVLLLANSSKGVYSFRKELLLQLKEKYEVVIAVPDTVCESELESEGFRVVYTPINRRGMNPFEDIKTVQAYRELLKREQPNLVLTYTIKPNIYGGYVCGKLKIPYMTTITGLGSMFQKEGLLKKIIVWMYQTGLKKAECVFFQNQQNLQIFKDCRIEGKKTKLVSGSGVNLEEHPFEEYPSKDETSFLFVGRIMKEKGIEELLEASKLLHSNNVKFEILGYCDEDYKAMLDEYEEKGFIIQHGFSKDVNKFMKNASALVLPTYHEGMSNVLMEASATGRPVIATSISGCKEIFEENVTGFGCEPKNSQSLVEALQKFIDLPFDRRAEMGSAARHKMEQEFDRNYIVNEYMVEIDQVLLSSNKCI